MPVQLHVQRRIQCSGHPCIQGQRQQEEVVHQMGRRIKEAEAAVKVMRIKAVNAADHHQEEELDQEDAWDQEQDHLHQEEDMEEAAKHRGAPHRSRQEEQAIHRQLHLPLQDFHSLHVSQIHGVH